MKKTFLKSVGAGIVGLSLTASCSMMDSKESHKCSTHKCSAKADEANKCSAAKKAETNKCSAKKAQ